MLPLVLHVHIFVMPRTRVILPAIFQIVLALNRAFVFRHVHVVIRVFKYIILRIHHPIGQHVVTGVREATGSIFGGSVQHGHQLRIARFFRVHGVLLFSPGDVESEHPFGSFSWAEDVCWFHAEVALRLFWGGGELGVVDVPVGVERLSKSGGLSIAR